ncbi:hypothetical protein HPP92_013224 [Vanilla planifolia]|uniref:Uncharacterized protein n=1 Tax=Vanilla planifolia TaxID=51239 RepID=A0A835QRA2_VANPL|nr:hypothetical protein HPP92_013224 [Vanilla planifolia]
MTAPIYHKIGRYTQGKGWSYHPRIEVKDGYGLWMIVQPRRKRNMGNNWSFQSQVSYGNNSLSQRYRSRDRQDRGYGRRRSNSVMRGRACPKNVGAEKLY